MKTFLIAFLLLILSSASTSIHQPGYCVFHDQADYNGINKPLANNTLAPSIQVNSSFYNRITDLCGVSSKSLLTPSADGETRVCCSESQFATLQQNLIQAVTFISTCPACWYNFVGFWCHFTCSSNQSLFIDLEKTVTDGKGVEFADELNVYVTKEMADGLYQSCSDVKIAALNTRAMELIGGGATDGFGMLSFLGAQKWQSGIEFKFPLQNIDLPEKEMKRFDAKMLACNDTEYGCTCVDCNNACDLSIPVKEKEKKCFVGSWDCFGFGVVVFYAFFVMIFCLGLFSYWIVKKFKNVDLGEDREEEQGLTDITHTTTDNNNRFTSDTNEELNCPSMVYSATGEEKINLLDTATTHYNTAESPKVSFKFTPWFIDSWLQARCRSFGLICAKNPLLIIIISLVCLIIVSFGLVFFKVETRPIKLWVDPSSKSLAEKEYFDKNFSPFYRITQLIITREGDKSVLDYDFLADVVDLELKIRSSNFTGKHNVQVNLNDLCIKPTGVHCAVQSFFGYYQNDLSNFRGDKSLDKLLDPSSGCLVNYGNIDCLSDASQPLPPNLVLGGVENGKWNESKAAVLNFVLKNSYDNNAYIALAETWEKNIIKFLKNQTEVLSKKGINIAFSTESSVEEELTRETYSDVLTIVISYLVMFLYASLALGKVRVTLFKRFPLTLFVDSRFGLGIVGVLIVIASVVMSVGLLSICGQSVTLIVAEVIPFLILAVGVDNIFILVNTFDRVSLYCKKMANKDSERPPSPDSLGNFDDFETEYESMEAKTFGSLNSIESRIAVTMSQVGPSLLLSSVSEAIAFSLGVFVNMPAVAMFSLFACIAIVFNFFLQITCFVAILTLDARRRETGRLDCIPCLPVVPDDLMNEYEVETRSVSSSQLALSPKSPFSNAVEDENSFLESIFKNYYAPFILNKYVKPVILLVFFTLFVFLGLQQGKNVQIGLDQKIVLPKDSYLINYFNSLENYLEVGPPLYFVFKTPNNEVKNSIVDMFQLKNQRKFCGKFQDCDDWSVAKVLDMEYRRNSDGRNETSTIASSSSVWFDDFVLFMNNIGRPCCVKNKDPNSCYKTPIDDPSEIDDDNPLNHVTSCACFKWRVISISDGPDYYPIFGNRLGQNPMFEKDHYALPQNRTVFMESLKNWMQVIPNAKCPTAGYAAYGDSISISNDENGNEFINSFYIRTYHNVLRNQTDFIEAMKDARRIAKEIREKTFGITEDAAKDELDAVYPYSVFYVFFEQYETIVDLTWQLVLYALMAIFFVSLVLLGSPLTSLIIILVVFMMVANLVGVMSLWNISLNALSAVNLVIAVGIGVEFCVHVARGVVAANAFDVRPRQNLVQRSLTELGSSVFSGITSTKIIGVVVLAFAKSEVFEVFYFRMYFFIVVFGALHGLVLLPVLLDLFKIGETKNNGILYRGPELSVYWKLLRRNN